MVLSKLSKFISLTLLLISSYFIFHSLVGYKGFLQRELNFYFLFTFLIFSTIARYLTSINFYKIILLFSENPQNVMRNFILYVYAKSNIFKYLPIKVGSIGTRAYYLKKLKLNKKDIAKISLIEYFWPNIINLLIATFCVVFFELNYSSSEFKFINILNPYLILFSILTLFIYFFVKQREAFNILTRYLYILIFAALNIFFAILSLEKAVEKEIFLQICVSFVLSQAVVSLVPFLPNIGFREIINYALLDNFIDDDFILTLLIILRVIPLIADLVFFMISYFTFQLNQKDSLK